ncbi:MAG: type IV pilus biogenesis protein PilM [Planctomycetota bacterium]
MEEKGSLGILLAGDKAVAVWASSDGSVRNTLTVMPDTDEPVAMALQTARAVHRQGFAFEEVFIAADCSSYTQYDLHSEFEDYRQIESTIKFDAEEAAATDAMNLAVTFEVTGSDEHGSQTTVYTADRQLMTDLLLDVQEGGLDPTMIEPDVVCLARALGATCQMDERAGTIFVVLSGGNCYMLGVNSGFAPLVRTFLVGNKDVTPILTREVLLMSASTRGENTAASIVLIGETDRVDTEMLSARTGLEISIETPAQQLGQTMTADSEMTCGQLLIAYGAALAAKPRIRRSDFRRDFMPYQGKRKVMEGSLRLIGISLTVLLIAVGAFFQFKTFRMKSYSRRLQQKSVEQYKALYGTAPRSGASILTYLKRNYTQIVRESEGGPIAGDSKSAPAKLMTFLEIVNKLPRNVDVQLTSIDVTNKTMKVKGNTNSRTSTNKLFNGINKHPAIVLSSQTKRPDGNRDSFDISIDPN